MKNLLLMSATSLLAMAAFAAETGSGSGGAADDDAEKLKLQGEAEKLGVDVDGRWSVETLNEKIEEAKKAKAKAPAGKSQGGAAAAVAKAQATGGGTSAPSGDEKAEAGKLDAVAGSTTSNERVGAVGDRNTDTTDRATRAESFEASATDEEKLNARLRDLTARETALAEGQRQLSEDREAFESRKLEQASIDAANQRAAEESGRTADEIVHGEKKPREVEGKTVRVEQASYINDAMREPGEIIHNYSGPIDTNLKVGTVEDRDGVQTFVPEGDNG